MSSLVREYDGSLQYKLKMRNVCQRKSFDTRTCTRPPGMTTTFWPGVEKHVSSYGCAGPPQGAAENRTWSHLLSYQPHRASHPKLQFEMASYNEPEYFARAEKSGHIIVRGIEQILRLYSPLLRLSQIPRSSTLKHTSPTIEVTTKNIVSKMTRV